MDPFPASLGLKPPPAMAQAQVVTVSSSSADHSAVDTLSHDPAPRVLTDPGEVRRQIVTDNSYPRVMIIDRDLTVAIEEIETPTDPKIRAAIDDLL